MMKQELKELFPVWTKTNQDRNLVMSNDLDSILSCTLLNQKFGYEINGYYDFDTGLGYIDLESDKKNIGVDIALSGKDMMCWDNHVTILNSDTRINKFSANINTIYRVSAESKHRYFKKFAGSTAMQIWSYYGFTLPSTDKGKMMLLSIDSAYLGFYIEKFKEQWTYYMTMLGFEDLIDFCERHTEDNFKEFKEQYTEHAYLEDGYVEYDNNSRKFVEDCLEMELYIPTEQFHLHVPMESHVSTISDARNLHKNENVFSHAATGVNKVKYTTIKNQMK